MKISLNARKTGEIVKVQIQAATYLRRANLYFFENMTSFARALRLPDRPQHVDASGQKPRTVSTMPGRWDMRGPRDHVTLYPFVA